MLAIAGGKGGAGKTTTTLGLAAALARQRRRPLAVDADADMPDLHVVADAPAVEGVAALAAGRAPGTVAVAADRWPDVSVVPAAPGAPVGDALPRLAARDRRGSDRPLLLDCPAGAGPDAAAPLRAADRVLVVTTPRAPAVTDALKTASMARELDASVAGVVVTRTDRRPRAEGDALGDRLGAAFDAPVLAAVPAVDGDPLRADVVRASYGRLAARISFQRGGPNN